MALNFGLDALIRAASALFYVGIAVLILAIRPRSPRGRPLALYFVAVGAPLTVYNLTDTDPTLYAPTTLATAACVAVASAALLALFAQEARTDPRAWRRAAVGALAGTIAGALLLALVPAPALVRDNGLATPPSALDQTSTMGYFVAAYVGTALVAAYAWQLASAPTSKRGGEAWLAAGLVLFPVGYYASRISSPHVGFLVASLVALVPVLLAVQAWARRAAGGHGFVLAVVACGVAVAALEIGSPVSLGVGGIARLAGCAFIVAAFLRLDLLDAARPTRGGRGALVTAGIAALLIVAQVAQNFLSAEYGLLIGGLVAGLLVVAARPIERALEGRREGRAPQPDAAKEDAFRAAVRMALRDRHITRDEELHLHRVAQHMGIPTGRAHELLVEVEREGPASPGV